MSQQGSRTEAPRPARSDENAETLLALHSADPTPEDLGEVAIARRPEWHRSMTQTMITAAQLTRLQVLWGQYARHDMAKYSRADRLIWASEQTKRTILSFKDLTLSEASDLINLLQTELGIKETSPAVRPRRFRSRIKDRDLAHAAGTEGRRGSRSKLTIASTADLGMIDAQLTDMGWTRDRLDAFL